VFTGIEEWIYEATFTLPAQCTDWMFSYALCCRNGAISTINAPLSENIYVYSMLNNTIGCNNSPTFTNKPVPFVCLGQQFCFNHGATDSDGDSLVYSLITPLGSSGLPITYNVPYSATQPLNSVPSMTFDTQSGDFCITPQSLQVTVMAVLVSEYRNGVLIGQVERDLQITVISCTNMLPSLTGINGTNEFTATVCQGEQLCFALFSNDTDVGQTVSMTWDQGLSAGNFSAVGVPHPLGSFCWTPTLSDVASSPHCFTVQVQDDACPYFGAQIYSYCITVINLVADAGANQTASCGGTVPITASATGSQGTPTYLWSNGFTGASQLVGPGTYVVTVTDGMCSDVDSLVVTPLAGPTAQFNYTAGCLGTPVSFSDQSSVTGGTTITAYNWSFGNGNTSSLQNPTHQYVTAGTYNVCLYVTTANGCVDTVCQTITILSSATAGFNAANACVNSGITFTNTSSPAGLNYAWNFGNGGTSNLTSPVVTYLTAGTYNVTLIAGTGSGCPDTITLPVTVYAIPTAGFNFTGGNQCAGSTVSFNDISSGTIASWNWDFGDGSVSTIQNPSHVYAATGTFTVCLVVETTSGCSDTICQNVTVQVSAIANFTTTNACINAPVIFNNTSTPSGINFSWNFGNGVTSTLINPSITYSTAGTYNVMLIAGTGTGCPDTTVLPVTIYADPVADFNYSGGGPCQGGNVTFTDQSTGSGTLWDWDFGNGMTSQL
ncbi:MAG: PKD domain-containing protein, partial [Solirubrobacterales bacterium]|nr:PKD domain-containing protein [Solirubrobacterales bacterium]